MVISKQERYERQRLYKQSPAAKAKRVEYDKKRYSDPLVRARMRAYRTSIRGKEMLKRASAKYRLSEKYKEYRKKYRNSEKCKKSRRNQLLIKNFGITLEEYNRILILQNSVCAICLLNPEVGVKQLAVDHCHKTGRIRGLLCRFCNQGIGVFREDVGRIARAINYLNKWHL